MAVVAPEPQADGSRFAVDPRRGATNLTPILTVLALIVMVGFFYWLYNSAAVEAERQAEVAAAAAAEDDVDKVDVSDAVTVALEDLARGASAYVDQTVRIAGFQPALVLGQQGFMSEDPFLVSSPELVAESGADLLEASPMTLIGVIRNGGDSTAARWVAEGTVPSGDEPLAQFAIQYLDLFAVEDADGTIRMISADEDEEASGEANEGNQG